MNTGAARSIAGFLRKHESQLLEDWMREQLAAPTSRPDLIKQDELRQQSREFLRLLTEAAQPGNLTDTSTQEWAPMLEFLGSISRSRATRGFKPAETATFILSLKQPLFSLLRESGTTEGVLNADHAWAATVMLDKLGLFTTERSLEARDASSGRPQPIYPAEELPQARVRVHRGYTCRSRNGGRRPKLWRRCPARR